MITHKGYVDFLIKVYFANVVPRFPKGGKMTQYLHSLNVGDSIKMKGPEGRILYQGYGNFIISGKEITGKTNIGLVAGGSGITPCLSLIQACLKNKDGTKLSLIFGNRTVKDILLKNKLKTLSKIHKNNLKLYFTVD